ncbi:glycosyltransferase [Roseibium aggregatum]|uniref:Glycosyltransferase n=1 Tax=Roseibium aggregatum TaxID=187304 RepID=A0A939EBB8_9HYPH|nr:glycosyltransferase [Roseibium aggregatum]MBN9669394.1 glycosyltransferase [Roseibium aggregatum]
MIPSTARVVIVTPVYEDFEASSRLFKELKSELGDEVFIVAVDDGSVKQPLDTTGLDLAEAQGVVLKLRRNVGHQKAIAIGVGYVATHLHDGQSVVVMDSDGEDLPSSIPTLMQPLASEQVDVVVAHRKSRVETLRFKAFYAIYKRLFRVITGRSISFGNFMAMKSSGVKRLSAMPELSIHVASAVLASKLRLATCPLDRGPRYAGQSKMNFVGLALHGFKGMMVFAEDVLVRVGIASAIVAVLSVISGSTAVFLKAIGYSTPGWASVVLGIMVLMFMQTGVLALMTLMLTGVVRSGTVTSELGYQDFIDEILVSAATDAPVAAAAVS